MNRPDRPTRLSIAALMLSVAALAPASRALGQGGSEQLSKILTDPEKLEELKKERQRPPIEFFRSQVMPNDILPYLKANHWSMVGPGDAGQSRGLRRLAPVQARAPGRSAPRDGLSSRRPAGQGPEGQADHCRSSCRRSPRSSASSWSAPRRSARTRNGWRRSGSSSRTSRWSWSSRRSANDHFARWSQFRATLPLAGRRDDPIRARQAALLPDGPPARAGQAAALAPPADLVDDQPRDLGRHGPRGAGRRPAASDDRLAALGRPARSSSAGAGPAFAPLSESFLAPYLPGRLLGRERHAATGDELKPLSRGLPAVAAAHDPEDPVASNIPWNEAWERSGDATRHRRRSPRRKRSRCSSPGSTPSRGRA